MSTNPPQWPDRAARTAHLTLHGWEPGQYSGGLCIWRERDGGCIHVRANAQCEWSPGVPRTWVTFIGDEHTRWDRIAENAFWSMAMYAEVWGNGGAL